MNVFTALGNRLEVFGEVWGTIRRNKLRTTLTGFAVTVGLFLLIFLVGSSNGVLNAFQNNLGLLSMDVINIYPGMTSKPFKGYSEGRQISFDQRDLSLSSPEIDQNLVAVTSVLSEDSVTLRHDKQNIVGSLIGVFPLYAEMKKVVMKHGRFINEQDMELCRKSIVLGENDAKELYGNPKLAIGQTLQVNNSAYTVVGVKEDEQSFGNNNNSTSLIAFNTLRAVYNKGINIGNLHLRTKDLTNVTENDKFEEQVRTAIARLHDFEPTDKSALWIYNETTGTLESQQNLGILRKAIWVIGLLTLLSGIVGISNIMLISVKERTREFGIRKALGAKPGAILREVIIESIFITIIFGYIGMLIGLLATEYLNYASHEKAVTIAGSTFLVFLNPTVDLSTALNALFTLVIAGILAGYFPARKAVRIKPVEALKG